MKRIALAAIAALTIGVVTGCAKTNTSRLPSGQELAAFEKRAKAERIAREQKLSAVEFLPSAVRDYIASGGAEIWDYEMDAGSPFTAAQIRENHPHGRFTVVELHRRTNRDNPMQFDSRMTVKFVNPTEVEVGIEAYEEGREGGSGARLKWTDLEGHAHFPEGTPRYSCVFDLPFGAAEECWVYAKPRGSATEVYTFLKREPGAPVRYDLYDGQNYLAARQAIVEYGQEEATQLPEPIGPDGEAKPVE